LARLGEGSKSLSSGINSKQDLSLLPPSGSALPGIIASFNYCFSGGKRKKEKPKLKSRAWTERGGETALSGSDH
jgi:hypothetical protein